MNKFKEQLQNPSWKLSIHEKNHMREALKNKMAELPAGSVISHWQWWHISPRIASLSSGAVMILIILMGGTAYAAQGSLPGDLLYPVKIHVTEPVQLALAVNSEQKAQVNANIASQRVKEAQTLVARGKLSTSTTLELQDSFNQHATEAIALANSVQTVASTTTTTTSSTTAAGTNSKTETPLFTLRLINSLNVQDMILKNIVARVTAEGDRDAHKTAGINLHTTSTSQHGAHYRNNPSKGTALASSTASSTEPSDHSIPPSIEASTTVSSSATTSSTQTAVDGTSNTSSDISPTQTSGNAQTTTSVVPTPSTPTPSIPPVTFPSSLPTIHI